MKLTVPEKHCKRIAISTLKMSDVGVFIVGGMNKAEAWSFLAKIGYSAVRIAKVENQLSLD